MYFNAQNCLLVANQNIIKVAKIPPLGGKQSVSEVFEPDKTQVSTIDPGLKIWGLKQDVNSPAEGYVFLILETGSS